MERQRCIIGILLIGVLILASSFFLKKEQPEDNFVPTNLSIHEKSWEIIGVADTEETRRQGLSHQEKLDAGTGLLFSFPEAGKQSFWMKDMRFPLDIIFIRPEGVVDSVALNRQPGDLTPIPSEESVVYVFEVNAGEAEEVQPGDRVHWK